MTPEKSFAEGGSGKLDTFLFFKKKKLFWGGSIIGMF